MSLVAVVRLIPTEPALVDSRKAAKPWVALNSLIFLSRSAEVVCQISGKGRQTGFEGLGIEYHRQKVFERIDLFFKRAKVVGGEAACTREAREVKQEVCRLHKSGAKPEVQA